MSQYQFIAWTRRYSGQSAHQKPRLWHQLRGPARSSDIPSPFSIPTTTEQSPSCCCCCLYRPSINLLDRPYLRNGAITNGPKYTSNDLDLFFLSIFLRPRTTWNSPADNWTHQRETICLRPLPQVVWPAFLSLTQDPLSHITSQVRSVPSTTVYVSLFLNRNIWIYCVGTAPYETPPPDPDKCACHGLRSG